jgi:hypothetical protein
MKKDNFKFLDSKKFNVTVTIINGVLIVIFVGYLIFLNMNHSAGASIGDAQTVSSVEADSLIEEADASMSQIYAALLQGSDFKVSEGVEFHFGYNGEYSGYFDADSKNVEAYIYNVSADEDNNFWLRIEDDNKSKYVKYEMEFDQNGNIILTYPGMEQSFLLEY